jgi:L-lactate dehydrogenase complex protein LldG
MTSREKILQALRKSASPKQVDHPGIDYRKFRYADPEAEFSRVLTEIGGEVVKLQSVSGIREYIYQHFDSDIRIVSTVPLLEQNNRTSVDLLHPYDNVELTIVKGDFAVAENGAVWLTDQSLSDRVLPFICQHLMVIIQRPDIVSTMHEAYARIGKSEYEFGTFIAGPSKTADIEQSLVLGAHGPKAMTVFLIDIL